MPTIKQLSRIFSQDDALNRVQDQLASALNPILRNVKGDLAGPLESPRVVGLQGVPIANVTPTSGQVLSYDGSQWMPVSALAGVVTAVTASSPLSSSGGTTPNISLTGVVAASNGGTGLSSPGTAGNVLVSTGSGWSSAASPGGPPSGPAGGVLHGTYPNPDAIQPTSTSGTSTFLPVWWDQTSAYTWLTLTNRVIGPYAVTRPAIGLRGVDGVTSAQEGGEVWLLGGQSLTLYNTKGGDAHVEGGHGSNGGNYTQSGTGGDAYLNGGVGGDPPNVGYGGDAYVRGGIGGSSSPTRYGNVYIGDVNTQNVYVADSAGGSKLYLQSQRVDLTTTPPTANQVLSYNGTKWIPASTSGFSALARFGNVAVVDAVNGNNATASINGLPFLTVEAGLSAVATAGTPATLWIMPGTYTLASATTGLTVPDYCAMRGLSTQTTKIVMNGSNPGGTVTLLTMGEGSRVEDLTLTLNSTNTTTNLVGVHTPGTTSTTSKIRTCVVTVDNSSLAHTTSTNVYGILDDGTGTLGPASFSFNLTRGVTINVVSNGGGNKRGVYVSTANDITFRDTNIYVKAPVSTSSAGSYVGVETNHASASAQFRTCSISGPTTAGSYTGSDILQTLPTAGYVDYGIQLGPGTDLINRTAGGKPFTAYITPHTLTYGLWGNVATGTHYMWPGTLKTNLDNTEVFYRVQQKCVLYGMSFTVRTAPGTGKTLTVTVNKSTTGVSGSGVATAMTQNITGATVLGTQYTVSVDLAAGDYISVQVDGTASIAAEDLVVELDLF